MCDLCDNDIESIFEEIKLKSEILKEKYGVKPIKNPYSDYGLAMVYLYHYLGHPVKINDIKSFVLKHHKSNSSSTLEIRHLRTDYGYYLLGSNGVHNDIKVKRDEYMLVSLDEPHPNYVGFDRHQGITAKEWKDLKEKHHNCCVTCGAKEGEPSPHNSKVNTELQKGHKDPTKKLTVDNCIPQCQYCNGVAKDIYEFDNDGLVRYISNVNEFAKLFKSTNDILKAIQILEEELKIRGIMNESVESI